MWYLLILDFKSMKLNLILLAQLLPVIHNVSGRLWLSAHKMLVYSIRVSQGSVVTCLRCGGIFITECANGRILKIRWELTKLSSDELVNQFLWNAAYTTRSTMREPLVLLRKMVATSNFHGSWKRLSWTRLNGDGGGTHEPSRLITATELLSATYAYSYSYSYICLRISRQFATVIQ